MRLTKKIIESHIDFLKNFLKPKKRKSHFGNIHDQFIYKGPFFKKYAIRNSGFFYEFNGSGVFAKGQHPDLHLSIIDKNGFAVPHVTFKPGNNPIEVYHYGYKTPESNFPEHWSYHPRVVNPDKQEIQRQLKIVFDEAIKHVYVQRKDDNGNILDQYPFNPIGTIGRAPDTATKQYGEYHKRRRSSLLPPPNVLAPLPVNKINKNNNPNTSNPRVSGYFSKNDPFGDI
jgi:hypothetical protein